MICMNCGFDAEDKYCPHCGQAVLTKRLTVKELIVNFWEAMTHAEHGLLLVVKELSFNPAHIAKEYISGKRKKYFSPVKYLVMVVTLSAVLILNYSNFGLPFEPSFPGNSKVDDVVEQDYFNHRNYKPQLFLSIPLASLISLIVFRKSGYNYAENLVLNTYLLAHVILFHTVLITPSLILANDNADQWIVVFYLLISTIYIVLAYMSFFSEKKHVSFFKALFTVIFFSASYNFISLELRKIF